jgi:hypothetical protein
MIKINVFDKIAHRQCGQNAVIVGLLSVDETLQYSDKDKSELRRCLEK